MRKRRNGIIAFVVLFAFSFVSLRSYAQTITVTVLTDPTTNGTANVNIYDGTSGLAVIGFRMVVTGSPNINNIYINTNLPSTGSLDNIFTSTSRNLVKVSTSNYATATVLSASSGNVNTNISGGFYQYVVNFNSVISAGTYYYFLVLKSSYMNTIPSDIQFSMTAASAFTFNSPSATVSLSSPTTTDYILLKNLYWLGSTDTNWDNQSNWYTLSGTTYSNANRIPGTNDVVYIGYKYISSNLNPTLSSTSPTVYAINFGTLTAGDGTCRLTVNGRTLTVTTDILKEHSNSNAITRVTLAGTGTINCASITIGNSNVPATGSYAQDSTVVNSRITNLHVTGNVTLISNASSNGSTCYFPCFNLDANTVTIDGQIVTTNNAYSVSSSYRSTFSLPVRGRFDVNHSSSTNALIMTGVTPLATLATDQGCDFNDEGTTNSTVTFSSSVNGQIIPTSSDAIGSVGGNYENLVLSGSGSKIFHGGTVTISGDLTTGNGSVDLDTNDPAVTITGNWVNSSAVTQGGGAIIVSTDLTNSGTLTLGSGNLTIGDDYTNSGTYTQGTGTTTFSGSSATLTDSGNGTTFNKVAFSGGGTALLSSGNFGVSSSGVLTLSNSTTLSAGGHLTLNSDATGSATVATIPSGSAVTGNVTVQRFIKGSTTDLTKRGYRLISSPVYAATLSAGAFYSAATKVFDIGYLKTSTIVTGAAGGGFSSTGNPSLYLFREDVLLSNASFTAGNFKAIAAMNNTPTYLYGVVAKTATANTASATTYLPIGTGLLYYFRGNNTLSNGTTSGTKTTSPYNYPEDVTLATTGTLVTGTVNVQPWLNTASSSLSYTTSIANNTAGSDIRGYNLVGNPYAATLNWEKTNRASTKSNSSIYISGTSPIVTIWVFNPYSKQYATYQQKSTTITSLDTVSNINPGTSSDGYASNMIASGQGFFIRANATSQTFSIRETAKTTTQPNTTTLNKLMGLPKQFAEEKEPLLRLNLAKDPINSDEIVYRFNNNATNEYADNEDAEDLGGNGALESLSSLLSDGTKLCIDSRPLPQKKQPLVIPLFADATASGVYTFTMKELKDLPAIYDVWLMDSFRKDSLDIKHNPTYVFDIYKDQPASFGANRFKLVIRQNVSLGVHLLDFAAVKASGGSRVTWKVENEQNYTKFFVERSTDNGQTFKTLDSLLSSALANYTYMDGNPVTGINSYRLKIRDLNGDSTYSKIIALDYSNLTNAPVITDISVYPNPTRNVINLIIKRNGENIPGTTATNIGSMLNSISSNSVQNFNVMPAAASVATGSGSYAIKIVNSSGSVIKTAQSSQPNWQTDVSGLLPGTYIIQVVNNISKSVVGKSVFVKL